MKKATDNSNTTASSLTAEQEVAQLEQEHAASAVTEKTKAASAVTEKTKAASAVTEKTAFAEEANTADAVTVTGILVGIKSKVISLGTDLFKCLQVTPSFSGSTLIAMANDVIEKGLRKDFLNGEGVSEAVTIVEKVTELCLNITPEDYIKITTAWFIYIGKPDLNVRLKLAVINLAKWMLRVYGEEVQHTTSSDVVDVDIVIETQQSVTVTSTVTETPPQVLAPVITPPQVVKPKVEPLSIGYGGIC